MSDPARRPGNPVRPDPWAFLRAATPARIALGRAGGSLPTRALLEFQLAHAQARDAVLHDLDPEGLAQRLRGEAFGVLLLRSAAAGRAEYVARPDLGRILGAESRAALEAHEPARHYDAVFVVADGLSARGVEAHALPLLRALWPALVEEGWNLAPVCVVSQGRVAVADEVGVLLGARMAVMLIGERPGLSSPDSLGIYLTWDPLPGRTNAERNCISNVRPPEGLGYELAAHKLYHLMTQARRRRLSGVGLKEDAPPLPASLAAGDPERLSENPVPPEERP